MEKKLRMLWSYSLIVISCITLIIVVGNMISIELSDIVKRILGVTDLAAVSVLIYSSLRLKKYYSKRDQ